MPVDAIAAPKARNAELTHDELAVALALAAVHPEGQSPLADERGAFLRPAARPFDEGVVERLFRKGLLAVSAEPELEPEWGRALQVLGNPLWDLSIIVGEHGELHYDRYFAASPLHSQSLVFFSPAGGGRPHHIAFWFGPSYIVDLLDQTLDLRLPSSSDDSGVELGEKEFVALVGALDALRERTLQSMLSRAPLESEALSVDLVERAVRHGVDQPDARWLVSIASAVSPFGLELETDQYAPILGALEMRGYLERTEQGWAPKPSLSALAESLVVIPSFAAFELTFIKSPDLFEINYFAALRGQDAIWLCDFFQLATPYPRVSIAPVSGEELAEMLAGLVEESGEKSAAVLRARREAAPRGDSTRLPSPPTLRGLKVPSTVLRLNLPPQAGNGEGQNSPLTEAEPRAELGERGRADDAGVAESGEGSREAPSPSAGRPLPTEAGASTPLPARGREADGGGRPLAQRQEAEDGGSLPARGRDAEDGGRLPAAGREDGGPLPAPGREVEGGEPLPAPGREVEGGGPLPAQGREVEGGEPLPARRRETDGGDAFPSSRPAERPSGSEAASGPMPADRPERSGPSAETNEKPCLSCGLPVLADKRFCRHCGADLAAPSEALPVLEDVPTVAPRDRSIGEAKGSAPDPLAWLRAPLAAPEARGEAPPSHLAPPTPLEGATPPPPLPEPERTVPESPRGGLSPLQGAAPPTPPPEPQGTVPESPGGRLSPLEAPTGPHATDEPPAPSWVTDSPPWSAPARPETPPGGANLVPSPPSLQTCLVCGMPVPLTARFCGHCGANVAALRERTCAGCKGRLAPNARFCAFCGQPVGA
jgi:hypothetical protein